MEKKIDQLLSGKFEYEQPQLLFSCDRLTVTLPAGETAQGELYFGTEENRKIRGYITSSDRRLVPGASEFSGTTICLPYGADATGLKAGETVSGWLCFTTNIGEYKLPFEIRVPKEEAETSQGTIRDIDMFTRLSGEDFREAFRIFTGSSFSAVMEQEPVKNQALAIGLTHQPVTYQHLEEFLVGMKKKDPVTISLDQEECSFYEVKETFQETFDIRKSGWGHLRLELEAEGSFLELPRRVLMDEDFIGSHYQISYVIHANRLGEGRSTGKITVRSPYQELTYLIHASRKPESTIDIRGREKRHGVSIYRDYLDFRMGKMDFKTFSAACHYELNALKEAGCYYPEYQLIEAYLLHKEKRDEEANAILKVYTSRKFTSSEIEFAGVWLYLCVLTGLYRDEALALSRIRNFYKQKEDSLWLFQALLGLDPEYKTNISRLTYLMEEQYERGNNSPLLYLQAWEAISDDVSQLHRLSPFWIQVFVFAGKNGLLKEELVMRLAYLSGYEKVYREPLYLALTMGYEQFPTEDTLEAICRYIMLGNPRRPGYFRWYSLAVEQGLRLTRLYEYYVETMDDSRQKQLPKSLLLYFTYNNNTLGDSRRAAIYASVLKHRDKDPASYESYQAKIKLFAASKLEEGKINENYAALYQAFFHDPKTSREARAIARKMYTFRLYCDDAKLRQVIVRHRQLNREETYPLVQGVAYPRLYTDDAVILFQDDKQRRYVSTVAYNLKKLLDERELDGQVLKLGADDPGVLLHYCEHHEVTPENLDYFERLVASDAFDAGYLAGTREKILLYYQQRLQKEPLDDSLKKLDFREYAQVDRKLLLELLIDQGMFSDAMDVVREFGCEGVDDARLTKLASRMISRGSQGTGIPENSAGSPNAEEDSKELLQLSSRVYRGGKYDGTILQYLMLHRFGPMEELLSIRRSAAGFGLDTYAFEERILKLLMFTTDYRKEGESVLESYVKQSGKGRVIGAYLTLLSYGIFVKEYTISPFVKNCLLRVYRDQWPVHKICRMTLLKALCKEKHLQKADAEMVKDLFLECAENNEVYAFYKKLPPELLSPLQLDDKSIVEYHADPKAKVLIIYELDSGLGRAAEKKSEPMKEQYQGIFTKTFTLFYGETVRYHFVIEENGKKKKTPERVLTMNRVDERAMSKYQMLNRILASRKLDKQKDVLTQMKRYLRQEQYVKELFRIRQE